jgi:hypothetical protein
MKRCSKERERGEGKFLLCLIKQGAMHIYVGGGKTPRILSKCLDEVSRQLEAPAVFFFERRLS